MKYRGVIRGERGGSRRAGRSAGGNGAPSIANRPERGDEPRLARRRGASLAAR